MSHTRAELPADGVQVGVTGVTNRDDRGDLQWQTTVAPDSSGAGHIGLATMSGSGSGLAIAGRSGAGECGILSEPSVLLRFRAGRRNGWATTPLTVPTVNVTFQ